MMAGVAQAQVDTERPLRMVVRKIGNCIFSSREIPPRAPYDTPTQDDFDAGDPMFARCYLPEKAGANRAGDLVDEILLDGKPWWKQEYSAPLESGAVERSIALSEILRTPLATLARGPHRLTVIGKLKRGGRMVQVYRGELRYNAR